MAQLAKSCVCKLAPAASSRPAGARTASRPAWLQTTAATRRNAACSDRAGRQVAAAAAADPAASGGSWVPNDEPTAAYIQIPFCKKQCAYCDFAAILTEGNQTQDAMEQYVQTVLREMEASRRLNTAPLETVFIGGGTPSLLPLPLLEQLLQALERRFGLAAGAEVSIEVNPGTFDADRLRSYMSLGINRVSLGAQAFQDDLLALLGRDHSVDDVQRAIEALHAAGVPSWNLELLLAMPQQTQEAWERTLELAVEAKPHHITTNILQVSEGTGTRFEELAVRGDLTLPALEDWAGMYLAAVYQLAECAGYEHYETSCFALPGHRCQYSMVNFNERSLYAFGVGCDSYLEGRRFKRSRDLPTYQKWVDSFAAAAKREGPQVAGGRLDSDDFKLLSWTMSRLRLADGLDLGLLEEQHPESKQLATMLVKALQPFIKDGVVEFDEGRGWETGEMAANRAVLPRWAVEMVDGRLPCRLRLLDPDGHVNSDYIKERCCGAVVDMAMRQQMFRSLNALF